LRANDPYYTDKDKNKRDKLEYSYETYRQQRFRRSKEIEFNRLFITKLYEMLNKNVESIRDYFP
jgi:hypothetical protein